MENVKWGLVGGGVLMALGSFLPWAQAGFISLPGTEGDGIFTLMGGVLVTIIGLANRKGLAPGLLVLLTGGLGLFITYSVFERLDTDEIGTGLYVAGLGSLVAVIASFDLWKKPLATPTPPNPAN